LRAIRLLNSFKSPKRYDALLEVLSQEADPLLRREAAKSFTAPDALPVLIRASENDPSPSKRRAAVGLIGSARITDPQVFPVLEQILSGEQDWAVRVEAVWAANKLESPQIIPTFQHVLRSDGEPAVRAAIAKSLGSLNDARAVMPLTIALAQDVSPLVREESAKSLGRLNDPQAIPALENGLKDPDPRVQQACLESLNKLKPNRKDTLKKR
jgi:HEAT repeat protein